MIRVVVLSLVACLLFRSASAQADIVSFGSMASSLEPLWAPLFGGGIVFGLALFAALKLWHAIKRARPR